ncbi:hypothetical protein [Cylindrospermopsis raciborskii]|uniref:hypothetical protein n=1 Tax=Cylindrospermopsis raciborskii TaxID=77022 RepID=UPI000C1C2212|nr:hypothetical protein [Cylindrospermopsis raciborskii]NLQ05920.1 hypothetical protein [Cylindrospermopsis raciborskii MVCC19]
MTRFTLIDRHILKLVFHQGTNKVGVKGDRLLPGGKCGRGIYDHILHVDDRPSEIPFSAILNAIEDETAIYAQQWPNQQYHRRQLADN